MRRRWRLVIFLLLATLALPATPALAANCQYILGFKTLHADLGLTVANCLDDQTFAANGDALQHTAHGLLVWRKSDNFTAFTDGYHTWICHLTHTVAALATVCFQHQRGGVVLSVPFNQPSSRRVSCHAALATPPRKESGCLRSGATR